MKTSRFCAWISLLIVPSGAMLPQQTPGSEAGAQANFSVASRLVVVDVVVRQNGQALCGLNQQDFKLRENGRPQAIQSFEAHCGTGSLARAAPVQLPPDTYTDLPSANPADAVNVLLLDGLNTRARDEMRARVQMIASLRTLRPGQRIAIFTLGSRLRMLSGFTTDTSTLVHALDGIKSVQPSAMLLPEQEKAEEEELVDQIRLMPGGAAIAEETAEFLNTADNQQTGDRIAATLEAFQQLARYLEGIPGRKNLLWFSGSFPLTTFQSVEAPGGFLGQAIDRSYGDRVRRTADLLAEARVAVYPVDVRGAITEPIYDLRQQGSIAVQETLANEQQDALNRIAERGTLDAVAQETGGRATYESNDLASAMTGAIEDGSHYYAIAYSPADTKFNGFWRNIQVTVSTRPSKGRYELHYRKGYFAVADQHPGSGAGPKDSFASAMREGVPTSSQVLFDVRVTADAGGAPAGKIATQNAKLQNRAARYRLDYAADLKDMDLNAAADGSRAGVLIVEAVAYNHDGLVVNSSQDAFRYQLNPQQWEQAMAKGLQLHQQIDVPAGDLFLRMGICDLVSGHIGTVEIPLQVSAATKNTKSVDDAR
jgi:VWFA-related protein